MKIKIKGFKSLIKAVRNRAHLVPVMTLINGKFKTYYGKRYVSPGEAMETAKEDFKINPYQEAIFESKDGKVKNITEKEVLKMYDEAGKPGVLQDFIKKNFKRPKVKASTKDNGQLSFDNMMQGDDTKPKDNKDSDSKQITEKLWQEFEKWREKAGESLGYIALMYNQDAHNMTAEQRRKLMTSFYSNEHSKEMSIDEFLEKYIQLFKDEVKKKEDRKNAWNDSYYKEMYNHLVEMKKEGKWRWSFKLDAEKYVENFRRGKSGLDFDAAKNVGKAVLKEVLGEGGKDKQEEKNKGPKSGITITGPIYDDDERPTYYINDNGNVIETQDTKIVDQYRAKQKQQEETQGQESQNDTNNNKQIIIDKLQQKGATIWEKNGHRRLYFNEAGKEVADRIAKEEDINEKSFAYECLEYFTSKTYLNLRDDKLYFPSNGSNGYNLDSNYFEKFIQYTKEMHNNIDTTSNDSVKLLNVEGEKELLRAIDGEVSRGNPYKAYFKPKKMLRLVGLEDNTLDGEVLTNGQIGRMISDLGSATINLITGKVTTRSYDRENIIPKVQEALDKLISEIKAETEGKEPNEPEKPTEPEKEIQKLIFRSEGLSGGLLRYNALRKGTTKIESKNEYKQIKNINELVEQVKPIKDAHANIKGRAIMDMFGISADLYTKANNIPFPIGPGAVGYCTRQYNEKTGGAHIVEIGLVADRNNPAAETKTAIHECMHAKIGMSGKNKLIEAQFSGSLKGEHLQLKIEEPMVELAGQALTRQIHGDEARKNTHSYATLISSFLPRVWSSDIFKDVRKQGALGIGQEIAKQLTNGNTDFINKVYDSFNANDDKKANSNRMKAIETKVLERTDKVEKIQNDTGVSEIANLVEELKRGTISLEGALNSSQYRELAAVLITKFLEDEDMEALEQLALSF